MPTLKSVPNKKLALALTAALLITGCTTTNHTTKPTPQNNSINGLYTLPTDLNNGYWVLNEEINGETFVVNYNINSMVHHSFLCNPDGTYHKFYATQFSLIPSTIGIQVQHKDTPIVSAIRLVDYQPNQSLTMLQRIPVYPDSIDKEFKPKEFSYRYTPTLTPLCGE